MPNKDKVDEKAQITEEQKADADAQTPSPEEKLIAIQKQADEMKDAFLRAKAEGENIRRRAQEDIAKAHKFAIENFAKSMLSVCDSLEMAIKTENQTVEGIKEGVDATLRQLIQVFEQNKITEIMPSVGDKLDPMEHQAISTVESDQEPNTVVVVLQKGYRLNERLLRPAIVSVSATKKS